MLNPGCFLAEVGYLTKAPAFNKQETNNAFQTMDTLQRYSFLIMTLIAFCLCVPAQEREEKAVAKKARHDAKTLAKEGWKAASGMPSIEEQLNNSYLMSYQLDSNGQHHYIFGYSRLTGDDYHTARMQALEMAKYEIISQIDAKVKSSTTIDITHSSNSAETNTHVSSAWNLKHMIPVLDLYRETSNQEIEVQIRIFYDTETIKSKE